MRSQTMSKADETSLAQTGAGLVYQLTSHDLFFTAPEDLTPEEGVGAFVLLKSLKARVETREKEVKRKVAADAVEHRIAAGFSGEPQAAIAEKEARDDKPPAWAVDGVADVTLMVTTTGRRIDAKKAEALMRKHGISQEEIDTCFSAGKPYFQVRTKAAPRLLAAMEGV